MSVNRIALGTLAYLVAVFPLAYAWHLVVFKELYDSIGYITRDEPIIALGFGAILFQGAIFAYLFPRFYRGGPPLLYGLKFAAIMGALHWTNHVLAAAAKHNMTPLSTWFAMETLYLTIQFLATGLALLWVYRGALVPVAGDESLESAG